MSERPVIETLVEHIKANGPTLGIDLVAISKQEILVLAPLLGRVPGLHRRAIETSYLRIDAEAPGQARISPSFLRKFISFTLFGFDETAVDLAAGRLARHHREISARKFGLAAELCREVLPPFLDALAGDIGVLICGDVVFDMAHDSRRREFSTGIPVKGSDIDLVILIDDSDVGIRPEIESALLRVKYLWLKDTSISEELDFIVKTPTELEKQLSFETTKDMIASKIVAEARALWGVGGMIARCQQIVDASGVRDRLNELEQTARLRQQEFERRVYAGTIGDLDKKAASLFYSTELNELGEFVDSRKSLIALGL